MTHKAIRLVKKPLSEGFIPYDSISVTFQEEKNYIVLGNRLVVARRRVKEGSNYKKIDSPSESRVVITLFCISIVVAVTQIYTYTKIH